MTKYIYIENENLPDIKLTAFEIEPFVWMIQLIDHQTLIDQVEGLTGKQVVKYGKYYGFELINPDMTNDSIVDFQHVGYNDLDGREQSLVQGRSW